MYKSGFVTLLGRPNVGKSTFLNHVLGTHLSIISPTAQTTRNSIKGIYTSEKEQIVFIDTPGIHKPKNGLGEFMNKQSLNSLKESDAVVWVVDATAEFGGGDQYLIHILSEVETPIILVFNKMDLIEPSKEEEFKENERKFLEAFKFDSVNYISSLTGDNVALLIDNISNVLPEGPKYYDENQITDSVERFISSELIREKIFLLTKEEIPHSVAVGIDQMQYENEIMNIYATIYVDRDSQKKIIIGAKGSMIKQIGTLARKDIQMLLGCKVYLELFVKVDKGWRDNKSSLSRLGYK